MLHELRSKNFVEVIRRVLLCAFPFFQNQNNTLTLTQIVGIVFYAEPYVYWRSSSKLFVLTEILHATAQYY